MNNRVDIHITEPPNISASLAFLDNITDRVDGVFSWSIDALGGFATAHVEMVVSEVDAITMLSRLGKRIVFTHPEAPHKDQVCWEGRIFTVTVDDGGATVGRSLENCYNRVTVIYSTVDTSTTPPTVGARARTSVYDDAASQALYGIRELRFATGGSTASDAAVLAQRLLSQYADPLAATASMRRGGGTAPASYRVSVECVGFVEELAVRFWNSTSTTVTTLDAIMASVLASPLQFIASDTTGLVPNILLSTPYQDEDINIRTYFQRFMSYGDGATGRQMLWGVYEDRRFTSEVASESVGYYTRRGDAGESVIDALTGNAVRPWLVRPGKLVQVSDLFPDSAVVSSALDNARTFRVGRVEFTAPATVIMTPLTFDSAQMVLARLSGEQPTEEPMRELPPPPGGVYV